MSKSDYLPLLPLRDVVVFPGMIAPLFVGRDKSIKSLNEVMKSNKKIILVTQKNAEVDDPNVEDLYTFEIKHIKDLDDSKPLAFDIETAGGQITCIGFAPSLNHALVVPFTYNYWAEPDRKKAWAWVKRLLEDETIVKVA